MDIHFFSKEHEKIFDLTYRLVIDFDETYRKVSANCQAWMNCLFCDNSSFNELYQGIVENEDCLHTFSENLYFTWYGFWNLF